MAMVAGVDGCRGGWVAVIVDSATRQATAKTFATAKPLFRALRACAMAVIDIPIGLPESGARACDQAARKMLSPHRHTSVFSAPIRPVLHAATYRRACAIRHRVEGRAMSKQAWNIVPRIVEVDRLLSRNRQRRVVEGHPELSFAGMNGGSALRQPKRTAGGSDARRELLHGFLSPAVCAGLLAQCDRRVVAADDLWDAVALAWTAWRIVSGRARRLPERPERDARGLRMEMWF